MKTKSTNVFIIPKDHPFRRIADGVAREIMTRTGEPEMSAEIKTQADELKAEGKTPTVSAFFNGRRFTGHGIRFDAPEARTYEDGTRSEPRYTP